MFLEISWRSGRVQRAQRVTCMSSLFLILTHVKKKILTHFKRRTDPKE